MHSAQAVSSASDSAHVPHLPDFPENDDLQTCCLAAVAALHATRRQDKLPRHGREDLASLEITDLRAADRSNERWSRGADFPAFSPHAQKLAASENADFLMLLEIARLKPLADRSS